MLRRISFIILILAYSATAVRGQSPRTELWFSPLSQEFNGRKWGASDFLEMFSVSGAKWDVVSQNISVFKFYPTFIGSAPDATLHTVFSFLNAHGIKTALEGSVLTPDQGCGEKVVGDSGNSQCV